MKNIAREHLKALIGVTILVVCTVLFISSNELIAKLLPEADSLTKVSCTMNETQKYVYTGEEIKPSISCLIFEDTEGNEVLFQEEQIEVIYYNENIEIGYADIEVELEGYRNFVVVEDAFEIVLGQTVGAEISDDLTDSVFLTWEQVCGADGYIVKKSTDQGKTYKKVKEVSADSTLVYNDTDIELNKIYFYKIAAFQEEETICFGADSEAVRYVSPLETPVISEIETLDCASIQLTWDFVDGAAGYQVFRSDAEDGAYILLDEVSSDEENTYIDTTCEISKPYFYYIVAGQSIDDEMIYGKASNVLSAQTSLGTVCLSGSTNASKTTASLKWNKVDCAEGYEIYRSKGSGFSLVETVNSETLSWTANSLDAETEYTFKVRAYTVVDGNKVYGSYSKTYTKAMKINYNYSCSGSAGEIVAFAGYPYRFGGKSTSGWDCSGFTHWIMKNVYGVEISTGTYGQACGGRSVSVADRSQWQVGDILVYKKGGSINHVSMYIGNGKMIHALNDKYDTYIQSVDEYESWDSNNLYSVRRYL